MKFADPEHEKEKTHDETETELKYEKLTHNGWKRQTETCQKGQSAVNVTRWSTDDEEERM